MVPASRATSQIRCSGGPRRQRESRKRQILLNTANNVPPANKKTLSFVSLSRVRGFPCFAYFCSTAFTVKHHAKRVPCAIPHRSRCVTGMRKEIWKIFSYFIRHLNKSISPHTQIEVVGIFSGHFACNRDHRCSSYR